MPYRWTTRLDPRAAPPDSRTRRRPIDRIRDLHHRLAALAAILLLLAASASRAQGPDDDAPGPGHFDLPELNAGLDAPAEPLRLDSPYDALLTFVSAARAGDFERAARAFNLNSLPLDDQAAAGGDAARRLFAAIDAGGGVPWESVPRDPAAGGVRAFTLEIAPDGEPFAAVLQRMRVADGDPVWAFSTDTLRAARALPLAYAPANEVATAAQDIVQTPLSQWGWLVLLAILGLAMGRGIAYLIKLATRPDHDDFRTRLAIAGRWPIAIVAGVLLFSLLGRPLLDLPPTMESFVDRTVVLSLIFSIAWLLMALLGVVFDQIQGTLVARMATKDDVRGRAFQTQVNALRRLAFLLLAVGAGAAALSQFEVFTQIGGYLLASAGVAGLVLGLAAQRTIGNVFAGLQLAIAQPVRIGDSVLFEGEWGWIEEISFTYVVIRTWDLRRVVVPVNYLLEHPIQNWTRTNPNLIGTVFLFADYRIPVDRLREELARILESTPLWNKKVPPILQVTDCRQEVLELRALCSANTAGEAWDLRCFVRERLLRFLQTLEGGRYLPRRRIEYSRDQGAADSPQPPAADPATGPPPESEGLLPSLEEDAPPFLDDEPGRLRGPGTE